MKFDQLHRREFITWVGGAAAAWPLAAYAQQPAMPVIGFLHAGSLATNRRNVAAFNQGLTEAGYAEGQNVKVEFRWANNELARLPTLAADLVDLQAAVIVAAGAVASPVAAKGATTTTPIVLVGVGDPLKHGLVASLNRPGGNVTGLTLVDAGLPGKRLDLVSQLVPQAMRIAYLAGPSNAWMFEEETSEVRQAAQALGREIIVVGGRSDFDFEIAFDTLVQRGAGALVVGTSPWAIERRHMIMTLAARHKVPAMYPFSAFAFDGGLMSYGIGRGVFRQVASHYVGQILKGAKPKDLPVQQPSNFELVINLKTARSLGIDVPDKLLALANEVIE
jgi:putative tryptophan/tyrosine transport system substrate-binding protein